MARLSCRATERTSTRDRWLRRPDPGQVGRARVRIHPERPASGRLELPGRDAGTAADIENISAGAPADDAVYQGAGIAGPRPVVACGVRAKRLGYLPVLMRLTGFGGSCSLVFGSRCHVKTIAAGWPRDCWFRGRRKYLDSSAPNPPQEGAGLNRARIARPISGSISHAAARRSCTSDHAASESSSLIACPASSASRRAKQRSQPAPANAA